MAYIRTKTSSASLRKLRGSRNRLHVFRDQSGSDTLSQHHLPHSATRQCPSRPALRRRPPSRRAQHPRLGRSRLGRRHDPQPPHRLLSQRPETNRVFALGHVSHFPPQSLAVKKALTRAKAATRRPNSTPQPLTHLSQPATNPTTRTGNSP
jgi:hypothetical protein